MHLIRGGYMKSLSIRLDESLGKQFDTVCQKAGYKKNTVVSRLIRAFVASRSGRKITSPGKKKDPFMDVIGIDDLEPLLTRPDSIDSVVYDL